MKNFAARPCRLEAQMGFGVLCRVSALSHRSRQLRDPGPCCYIMADNISNEDTMFTTNSKNKTKQNKTKQNKTKKLRLF
jgi:hypothetical protein